MRIIIKEKKKQWNTRKIFVQNALYFSTSGKAKCGFLYKFLKFLFLEHQTIDNSFLNGFPAPCAILELFNDKLKPISSKA